MHFKADGKSSLPPFKCVVRRMGHWPTCVTRKNPPTNFLKSHSLNDKKVKSKEDFMDEFVERLAGIGAPALVFLIIMSTTGLAGAAAITATLALLGPGGMIGGVITLIVIGAGASVISKYGYSAIITATCKKIMQKDNLTREQMCEKIDKYPITKGLKEKVKAKIREA